MLLLARDVPDFGPESGSGRFLPEPKKTSFSGFGLAGFGFEIFL